jgi:transcriptional regulator with XRE-family HTH domain
LRLPTGVDPPLGAWTGGHLTARQAQWALDRLKSTAQTQEDVARAAGLSRPQLTNALRGRFGLSEDAARRVHEVLDALPVVQPGLGFL